MGETQRVQTRTHLHDAGGETSGATAEGTRGRLLHHIAEGHLLLLLGGRLARELADDGHGRGGEISSGETGAGGDAGERGARARGKLESAALLRGHENSFGRHLCRRAFEV